MASTIPLRTPLDDSELPHPAPTTAATSGGTADVGRRTGTSTPDQGVGMPLDTIIVTADEHRQIFERLAPHLPPYLRKVEPNPSGWGLRFTFAAFTGREKAPTVPPSRYDDPRLKYVPESENRVEHRLREAADHILGELYDQAYREWKDAAYVADLREIVRDAPDRWKTYEREAKALESAYAHLRTPQAATEWPAAISRLVDAQERALAAADAFDERAVDIAHVHSKHLYADLIPAQALAAAGYPGGAQWHVGNAFDGYFSDALHSKVRRLVDEQEAHVAKVARLSGMGD
ncbi:MULTISPECIES: hypothetical protein [Streptomyces]|uniref:hypothetical protein n=1 Tax=Streptomyces TaxID=1883 RepID=UPI00210AAF17|nr:MULTISPECIES: hypothetical protein [Streptomyces]UUA11599.1 hypothetical protein NNW98_38975 [Streptomyces koelreuteriae]UUA19196.1 hypothetical protein NNW99_38840 [Streptomyces sp. CRCS-T-1]